MPANSTDLTIASWLPRVSLQADLNTNMEDEGSSFYGVSSQYESPENMIITCSTKVCSFGKQVVEKVEVGAPCELVKSNLFIVSGRCSFPVLL